MKATYKTLLTICLTAILPCSAEEPKAAGKLVTVEGEDAPFAKFIESGAIKTGERFSKGPVHGSLVRVNQELLGKQTGKAGPIQQQIGLHTQGSGGIKRKDFANWTRWYQEDGNVQIFRLFAGEQNIRSGAGENGSPGRVEVYAGHKVSAGEWSEWEGTYTIVEPVGANIFQLFHEGGQLWPFHIRMNDEGDIFFARRRTVKDMPDKVVLAEDMAGKSLRIKVRANGTDYEVFCKSPTDTAPWGEPAAKGSYKPAVDSRISFRWGMYCGSKKGQSVSKNALLLVSDVVIREK